MGDATARATTGDTAPVQETEEKDDEKGADQKTAVIAIATGGIGIETVGEHETGRGALAETDTRDEDTHQKERDYVTAPARPEGTPEIDLGRRLEDPG